MHFQRNHHPKKLKVSNIFYYIIYRYITSSLVMLSLFVEADVANNAFRNGILIEENVEVQPEKVPMKCLDEDVSINLIRKYFTFDGWKQVEMIMGVLQEKGC